MLEEKILRAKKKKTTVPKELSTYAFKDGERYAEVTLRGGVFYTNDRLFEEA